MESEPCKYCGRDLPRHNPRERGCRTCYLAKKRVFEARRRERYRSDRRQSAEATQREHVNFKDNGLLRRPII